MFPDKVKLFVLRFVYCRFFVTLTVHSFVWERSMNSADINLISVSISPVLITYNVIFACTTHLSKCRLDSRCSVFCQSRNLGVQLPFRLVYTLWNFVLLFSSLMYMTLECMTPSFPFITSLVHIPGAHCVYTHAHINHEKYMGMLRERKTLII